MLRELIEAVEFPEDILTSLNKHLNRPKASSCSDPDLFKVLKKYNAPSNTIFLEEINEGDTFVLHKTRVFRKGRKRRTRFECAELASNRVYLISGHAEVEKINKNNIA